VANKKFIEKKIVAVSDKRRLTIPKKFYSRLKLGNKVECIARGNELILRPVNSEDFSDLIVEELKPQKIDKKILSAKVKAQKAEIEDALNVMIDDAKKVARGEGDSATFGEIFGDD